MVELLRHIGHDTAFMLMDGTKIPWKEARPLNKSGIRMLRKWKERLCAIHPERGRAMKAGRRSISHRQSVVITPDVPGYVDKGVKVPMWNMEVWVPVGAAKLATEMDAPILAAIPWTEGCTRPYKIFLKRYSPQGSLKRDMAEVVRCIETAISKNPVCWAGWVYIHKLAP
jgi:lauroyl/myristoyl acyltransferase